MYIISQKNIKNKKLLDSQLICSCMSKVLDWNFQSCESNIYSKEILMNVAETIKFLRLERGFSQKDILPKGVTSPTYSKFENNKQDLKIKHIFEILDNMDITTHEFTQLLNRKTKMKILQDTLISCANNINDPLKQRELITIYKELQSKDELAQYEFAALLNIKEFFNNTISEIEPISAEELNIKKIILSRHYHGYRDYHLISNHIMNFSNEDVDLFIDTLFPITDFKNKSPETQGVIIQLFVNLMTKEMYENNLDRATKFHNIARRLDIKKENYYLGIQLLYFDSIIKYLRHGETEYLEKINEVIKMISYMGDHQTVKQMQKEVQVFLQNKEIRIPTGKFPMLVIKNS